MLPKEAKFECFQDTHLCLTAHRSNFGILNELVFLMGDECGGSRVWDQTVHGKVRQEAVILNTRECG